MKSLAVKIWLSVLLLLVAVYAAYSGVKMLRRHQEGRKTELHLRPDRPLSDFRYTERSGRTVQLSELAGDVFCINFFFANCPGTCKMLSEKVAVLHRKFGPNGVKFVSVTIDPAHDTLPVLQDYADKLHADENWWFLTGPIEQTQELGLTLKLTSVGRDARGALTHTDDIVVIDRAGVIRGAFDHRRAEELKKAEEMLAQLLGEKAPSDLPGSALPAAASPTTTPSAATPSPATSSPAPSGTPSATAPAATPSATPSPTPKATPAAFPSPTARPSGTPLSLRRPTRSILSAARSS